MRIKIQGLEDDPRWAFSKIPAGEYKVPATVEPDEGDPYVVQWPVELTPRGTLYYASAVIRHGKTKPEFKYWWRGV